MRGFGTVYITSVKESTGSAFPGLLARHRLSSVFSTASENEIGFKMKIMRKDVKAEGLTTLYEPDGQSEQGLE